MSGEKTYTVEGVLPVKGGSLSAGTNVLLTGPSRSGKTHLCADFLASSRDSSEGALAVTTDGDVQQILDVHREGSDEDASTYFIDCSRANSEPPPELPPDRYESVSSPGDMTGVGIAVEKYLKKTRGTVEGTRVAYDSLTSLLQYVDSRRAYQFVDVMTGRFSSQGYVSVFTIDKTAVDDKVAGMFGHEFDIEARIRVSDGEREISIRGDGVTSPEWKAVES
jgi:KaiC/GvpD/RAD55 family RecA-like ATPase